MDEYRLREEGRADEMLCYMAICKAPLTEGYSEALCLTETLKILPQGRTRYRMEAGEVV